MAFWNRKSKAKPETKSHNNYPSIFEYLSQTGWGRVTAWQALRYYEQIAPVAIGVDKVTDEFKSLQPAIFDKDEQKYETSHPFLEFLQHPNASISQEDFFKNYGTYYQVTGEVYLVATGNPNRPPLELFIVQPQFVSIETDSDGFPQNYKVSSGTAANTFTFTRKEVNKKLRYFDNMEREIWHVKDFNPNASSTNFHGASRLNPIYFEIEQHLSGSEHNLALLQNGGRLTGALVTEQVLEDDTFKRLKEEVRETIQGSRNAGAIPVFEGGMSYTEMAKSNRDMDFATLMNSKAETIYTRLNIPLPMITAKAMTLNNLGVANLALYDFAVMPLMTKLFGELTLFLGGRFGLKENQTLSVDPVTVPALQARRLANLLQQNKMGILTDNEQRATLGRERYEGGDTVYKPANLVPAGQDADTEGNRDEPAARAKFIEIMIEQKDIGGNRRYTDEQIMELADKEGLYE